MQPHPAPDELRRFALGQLDGPRLDAVADHVAGCEACCQLLRGVADDTLVARAQEAHELLDSAPAAPAPDGPGPADDRVPAELRDHPRYRIVGRIGQGGMGVVYRAHHRLLDRTVALKVINPRYTADPRAVERFRREARLAGRLSHPNVVTAFDADQVGGTHFLVLEYVEGKTLDALVAEHGPLSVANACEFLMQAAVGLQYAHDQGLVHRDVKPHNLMLTRTGRVKVLDLGLARLAEPGEGDSTVPDSGATSVEMIVGTPDYLSPEQARAPARVDGRADVYGLGCTLYFLLAGRPPFPAGSAVEKVMQHCKDVAAPIERFRPDVPPALAAALRRMMAKDPGERHATAADVADALAPFRNEAPRGKRVAPERERTEPARAPRRAAIAALAGALAVLLVGALVAALRFGAGGSLPEPVADAPAPVVLFALPPDGLWFADYRPVRAALEERGVKVVVASARQGLCELYNDPLNTGEPVHVDVVLDGTLRAAAYDALVCVGVDSAAFAPDTPAGDNLRAIAEEYRTSRDKYVAAVCLGQRVLGKLGVLKGRLVAGCHLIEYGELKNGYEVREVEKGPVVVHGQVVTAAHADHGAELGRKLAELLTRNGAR